MPRILSSLLFLAFLSSCTTDIVLDVPVGEPKLVVEGSIDLEQPPFILITRSKPYFNSNPNDLDSVFVDNAEVKVVTKGDTFDLVAYCVADFPAEQQAQIAASLGFVFVDSDNIPNICLYSSDELITWATGGDIELQGEENTQYDLIIDADGQRLTATTRVPFIQAIDSLSYRVHPNPVYADSLRGMIVSFTDDAANTDFIRYWTESNSEGELNPVGQYLFDDRFWNGEQLDLLVSVAEPANADIDFTVSGYAKVGDTVAFRWATMDKAHYDFWVTIISDGGDSPFSSPVKIKSNINGGLGIWGGYASYRDTIIVRD